MAQLRHDYAAFRMLNAEVFVIVPNGPKLIARHVERYAPPYPILSDKGGKVAADYGIHARTTSLVRLTTFKPSVFLVDSTGQILYANYLTSYVKEPDNQGPLDVLAGMAAEV
jgi:peroxiredoxin